MKKIIALVLALILALSMVACNKTPAGSETKPQENQGTNKPAETKPVETKPAEPVSLRLVMFDDVTPRREEYLKNEFHDKVLEELNIDLSVEFLPWSGKDTLQTMLIAGEKIAFNNTPAFTDFAQRGLCAEIPMELIEATCPDLLAMREEKGFDSATVDGKIYYIPFGNKSMAGSNRFFTVRNDILKKLGINAAEITTTEQLLEVFEAVHQAYPNMRVVVADSAMGRMLGDTLTGELVSHIDNNFVVYANEYEDNDKLYSWYESENFKKTAQFNALLVEKGYSLGDYFTDPDKANADWNAGNCFAKTGVAGHVVETGFKATIPEAEITRIRIGDAPLVTGRDFDWGMSVSTADAENTEHWLRLFNWMYKDQETFNFLVYGVEGKDFEYNADGTINKLVTDAFWQDWFMMANCYTIYDPSIPQENIDLYNSTDKGAITSKLTGFSFDSSYVSNEVALVKAVISEYLAPIHKGLVDYDANIENALKQLKDAGLDTLVAEYQRQYSEWYAANN